MGKRIDIDSEQLLKLYMGGKSISYLSKLYKNHPTTLRTYLKKQGVMFNKGNKKYFYNESYFKVIDSSDKAYFLGLLLSDGYNIGRKREVGIDLQDRDKAILEKFKIFLNLSKNLTFLNKKTNKHRDKYSLKFYGETISKDLTKYGCISPKALVLKFPDNIDEKYYSHIIRGYFDGDGCIMKSNVSYNGYYRFSITSTKEFLEEVNRIILLELGIELSPPFKNRKDNESNTYTICHSKIEDLIKLREWLYKDSDGIYLNRKYLKFQGVKKIIKKTPDVKCNLSFCDNIACCQNMCKNHYQLSIRNPSKFKQLIGGAEN